MKQIVILLVVLCVVTFSAQAQRDRDAIKGAASAANSGIGRDAKKLPDSLKWKRGGDFALNFSQTSLSNWSAGGEKSLSFSSVANLFANYKKNKVIWENYAFMAYGMIKAGNRKSVKNNDQINFGSRAGYQMAENWYYTAALLGKSQFATGYKYTSTDTTYTSNFLAPAFLYLSLGLDYKPSDQLFISFAPAMGKATYVRSNVHEVLVSSGMPEDLINDGKRSRYEFGAGIVLRLNGSYFAKKVTYSSQLELFSNYFDKPQNIDVIWDFQFRCALSKYVSAGVRLNMIYFDSQKTFSINPQTGITETHGPKLQVKEYFDIGLYYSF